MEKRAIHFGVETRGDGRESCCVDGVKDAGHYHLLSRDKGFESQIQTSKNRPIGCSTVKKEIKNLSKQSSGDGVYFISITANSLMEKKRWIGQSGKVFNKSLLLHDGSNFGLQDLNECLSYFSKGDQVFFLVSDCGIRSSLGWKNHFVPPWFMRKRIKAQAVVLSLSFLGEQIDKQSVNSFSSDINFVINSAQSISDLLPNLEALHGDKSFVRPELFCYNLAERNAFFLNN